MSDSPTRRARFELTHVDGDPLPAVIHVAGAVWVIVGGRCIIEAGSTTGGRDHGDDRLEWMVEGVRPPLPERRGVLHARYPLRRMEADDTTVPAPGQPPRRQSPVDHPGLLTVRLHSAHPGAARELGCRHDFRFTAIEELSR